MRGTDDHSRPTAPSVVAITMVKDEGTMLPRWIDHYGRALGHEHLLVVDDESTDGSTTGLPCPVLPVGGAGWKPGWTAGRRRLVSSLANAMLACYDVVIFTDVDEFLVPDPLEYSGLLDYLTRNDARVIAPVGVNVLHDEASEPALDLARPVTEQRTLVKFAPVMCKPGIKRIGAEWTAGFHGIRARYRIHPDLLLLHLKYSDVDELARVSTARHDLHLTSRRGGRRSAWAHEAETLAGRMRSWTEQARQGVPPEFDPYALQLKRVVKSGEGDVFQSEGGQLLAMERQPLRTLPPRFRVI